MSNLRVKIDDFVPSFQPTGLDDLNIEIRFEYNERTLLKESNNTELNFNGDAYEYLFNSFKKNRYNGVHSIEIQKKVTDTAFQTIYKGNLFIADCVFDIDKKYCTVTTVEQSYTSYIQNNKKIKANYTVGKTKNGLDTSEVTLRTVELINPPSNTVPAVGLSIAVTSSTSRKVAPIKDVLSFLVSFMSDNNVELRSEYLTKLTSVLNTNIGIIQGRNLRTNENVVTGKLSYEDVYRDIAKLLNLIVSTDTSTSTNYLVCENFEYYQDNDTVIEKSNIKDIKMSFVQELLFSGVSVGSKESITDGSVGALTYVPPFDFKNDNYYITGLNNIDNTLQLNLETFIIDSNIIEDIIVNNNDEYDDDWFLITYNETTAECWTPGSQIFSDGFYYYNGDFINKNMVNRYKLQGALVSTQGDSEGDFIGLKGSTEQYYWLNATPQGLPYANWFSGTLRGELISAKFNNVISDPSGAWNTTTNKYTALSNGVRNINLTIQTNLFNNAVLSSPNNMYPYLPLVYIIKPRFKVNGTYYGVLNLTDVPPSYLDDVSDFNLYLGDSADTAHLMLYEASTERFENTVVNTAIYLNAADELEIEYGLFVTFLKNETLIPLFNANNSILMSDLPASAQNFGWVQDTSGFYLLAGNTGLINLLQSTSLVISGQGSINGVQISPTSTNNAMVNKYEFDDELSAKEMYDLINNPQKSILLQNNVNGVKTKLWAYRISINPNTGKTNFEMFNNINEL